MKRMLFNAAYSEELRVAMVNGQDLVDLEVENSEKKQKKSNIYKGVVTRIEPSLDAAFVNYGVERHGFLPFREISRSYFSDPSSDPAKVRIQNVIKEGQEIVVQVDKDERGNKGAALTTFISLAGRYLVLMPKNPKGGGISRRIEGDERAELKEKISKLDVPKGMSLIARTAGISRSEEELEWDLNYLIQLWDAIDKAAISQNGVFLIYQDASLVIRAIRDHFNQEIGELLFDTKEMHDQAKQFMTHVMPKNINRVKLYDSDIPIFTRFHIEKQIQTAYSRKVPLPSGGSIVIDHAEALVAIDVNSAKSTKGTDIEETASRTNLEAAFEIPRQLRLRDIGGLIVIDFIDMEESKHQREIEIKLKEGLERDKARIQLGKISRFGLLELSRQRLNNSLGENNTHICVHCEGTGRIRSTDSIALHILRLIHEESLKDDTNSINVEISSDVAEFLLNKKRDELYLIEQKLGVKCNLVTIEKKYPYEYEIKRIKKDGNVISILNELSSDYKNENIYKKRDLNDRSEQKPVVSSIDLKSPPLEKKSSLIKKILKSIIKIFKTDNNDKKNRKKKYSKNNLQSDKRNNKKFLKKRVNNKKEKVRNEKIKKTRLKKNIKSRDNNLRKKEDRKLRTRKDKRNLNNNEKNYISEDSLKRTENKFNKDSINEVETSISTNKTKLKNNEVSKSEENSNKKIKQENNFTENYKLPNNFQMIETKSGQSQSKSKNKELISGRKVSKKERKNIDEDVKLEQVETDKK